MMFPAPKKKAKVIKPNASMSVTLRDLFKLHLPTRFCLYVVSTVIKIICHKLLIAKCDIYRSIMKKKRTISNHPVKNTIIFGLPS